MATGETSADTVPVLALAMGDPAGIAPELTAKIVCDAELRAAARLVVLSDRRVLEQGAHIAQIVLDIDIMSARDPLPSGRGRPVLIDLGTLDPATISLGAAQEAGGRFAVENFKSALACAVGGAADAVCYTPFNKAAMRLAHAGYEDDGRFVTDMLGSRAHVSEFNVLPRLWNARVTSHVPLSAVSARLSRPGIVAGLVMTDKAMREAGFDPPRIAVAAINPHAGDNGNFGREEIDIIGPAVADAIALGIICEGPFPSDTVFLRALRGQFDAVLTMYHDQGQIAFKLIGFDEGVTLLGGLPFPVTTPAHGSAYDIAGRGVATMGASKAAVLLAARMACARLAQGQRSSPCVKPFEALRQLIQA